MKLGGDHPNHLSTPLPLWTPVLFRFFPLINWVCLSVMLLALFSMHHFLRWSRLSSSSWSPNSSFLSSFCGVSINSIDVISHSPLRHRLFNHRICLSSRRRRLHFHHHHGFLFHFLQAHRRRHLIINLFVFRHYKKQIDNSINFLSLADETMFSVFLLRRLWKFSQFWPGMGPALNLLP